MEIGGYLNGNVSIHNFFVCCASVHGYCHALPLLIGRGCIESFQACSLDYCYRSISQTTGRLTHTSQGNCLYKVMGRKLVTIMREKEILKRGSRRNVRSFFFSFLTSPKSIRLF